MTYTERGEIREKILEKLKENPMTMKELVGALGCWQTTVSYNLNQLVKSSYVEKMGGYNAKYRLINDKNIVDMKKVNDIVKRIEENGDSKEVLWAAASDLFSICRNQKITKQEQLDYFMKKAKNAKGENKYIFSYSLYLIVSNIIRDHDMRLKGLLERSLDLEYFKEVLLDEKEDIEVRYYSLSILQVMNYKYEEMVNIAFELIKNMDEETKKAGAGEDELGEKLTANDTYRSCVRIIMEHSKNYPADAEKRLYKLLKDEKPYVRERVSQLLLDTQPYRLGTPERDKHYYT